MTEEDVVKEGWLKEWTPQVVIGSDDISSHTWGDTDKQFAIEDFRANGFNNRYYIAATKQDFRLSVMDYGVWVDLRLGVMDS